MEPMGGMRDAPLGQHRVEDEEQVEIEGRNAHEQ
jgi:hypothetical protein